LVDLDLTDYCPFCRGGARAAGRGCCPAAEHAARMAMAASYRCPSFV
jgi:hypothetical protein